MNVIVMHLQSCFAQDVMMVTVMYIDWIFNTTSITLLGVTKMDGLWDQIVSMSVNIGYREWDVGLYPAFHNM